MSPGGSVHTLQSLLSDHQLIACGQGVGHPIRLALLRAFFEDGRASPARLAARVDVSLPTVSYHVKRLSALGFLELVDRVPRRGVVEHQYELSLRGRLVLGKVFALHSG